MQHRVIFGTPIWNFIYPNFDTYKEKILSCIYKIRENDPIGVKVSNINGYQSNGDLVDGIKYPELNRLFDFIGQTVVDQVIKNEGLVCDISITSAWANINDNRSCINTAHVHGDVFSGIFYIKAPEGSGELVFQNNSLAQAWNGNLFKDKKLLTDYSSIIQITPKEGQLMIWHSYLTHYVLPNNHDDERVSIAFNINCVPKKIK